LGKSLTKGINVVDAVTKECGVEDKAPIQLGVYIQQNGSQIPLRGGIYRPAEGSFIRSVEDIKNLPWTKDGIVDAFMFRMCDEYVRRDDVDWETKRAAIFAMIYHSYGYIGAVGDDTIRDILNSNPYEYDDNSPSVVKFWQLGIIDPDMPPPMATE
jgi:hypothetical protein